MRYERVIVTRYGGPEVISLIEEDLPAAPQPEEVRVKVLAAGVSLPDVLAREDVAPP
jgi:NADPH:quinone reductase-like Zn-dependent oxidoreductase